MNKIDAINASPKMAYVVVTGGGMGFVSEFLTRPGGSSTIIKVEIPYSEEATIDFLGFRPKHFASEDNARDLAAKAFDKAQGLHPNSNNNNIGVALTASLATNNEREGRKHRVCIAISDDKNISTDSFVFKGGLNRELEDEIASHLLLVILARYCANPFLEYNENYVKEIESHSRNFYYRKGVVFPGSFNPPHQGHKKIAELAGKVTKLPVLWELSVDNFEKPSLSLDETERRLKLIKDARGIPIVVRKAPLFNDKIDYYNYMNELVFAMGHDTFERIFKPGYFASGISFINKCFNKNARIVVAGGVDDVLSEVESRSLEARIQLDKVLIQDAELSRFYNAIRSTHIRNLA